MPKEPLTQLWSHQPFLWRIPDCFFPPTNTCTTQYLKYLSSWRSATLSYNTRAAWIVTATDAMKYGTSALSLTRMQDLNDFDQMNSAYMNNIDKEVKGILTSHGIRFPKKCVHIIPSVCHPFDVDIAQSVSYNTDSRDTIGRDASLSTIVDIDAFHGVVWSCSQSRGDASSVNVMYIKRQIISFADSHFQSATTVSAMSQLELGCLASWLSWYPSFFIDRKSTRLNSSHRR